MSINNLYLATAKSVVFGADRAHRLPLRPAGQAQHPEPGRGTTASVVTSITAVILVDALFAVLFKDVGI